MANSVDPNQMQECGFWSGSTQFAHAYLSQRVTTVLGETKQHNSALLLVPWIQLFNFSRLIITDLFSLTLSLKLTLCGRISLNLLTRVTLTLHLLLHTLLCRHSLCHHWSLLLLIIPFSFGLCRYRLRLNGNRLFCRLVNLMYYDCVNQVGCSCYTLIFARWLLSSLLSTVRSKGFQKVCGITQFRRLFTLFYFTLPEICLIHIKVTVTTTAGNIFINIFFIVQKKNKGWHFMWIVS